MTEDHYTLRAHLAYLRYVIRHKWFVLLACPRVGASLWRGLVHDVSKLRPSEWGPYLRTFYAPDGSKRYAEGDAFAAAWNLHQKRNPHHWQFWLLTWDRGETVPVPMPERYVREMVADWIGAGRAITGKAEVREWYERSRDKMRLHPDTRRLVEDVMQEAGL